MTEKDAELTPRMMCTEINSLILEKRKILADAVAKRRMKEMVDITRMRLDALERTWIFLNKIAEGKLVVTKAASEPPKPPQDKVAEAVLSGDISDEFPD